MIRKLEEKDRQEILEFLSEEAAINLFAIGDIEAFGFDKEFQELWGQFDADEHLEGILLRFNENFIPYWKNEKFDAKNFKEIILSRKEKTYMSGKENIINSFEDILPNHERRKMYFCEMKEIKKEEYDSSDIKIATIDDCERICDFLDSIEEFTTFQNEPERLVNKIESNSGRIYFIENEEGEVISVSQTVAENSMSAMVVGVATRKDHRGQGLMRRCLSKLCRDMTGEGRSLCLFYDNPKAGKIYLDLGFKPIDDWVIVAE